jgi:hypothetical protein
MNDGLDGREYGCTGHRKKPEHGEFASELRTSV